MRYSSLLLFLLAVPGGGQTIGLGIKGALPVDGFHQIEYQYRYGVMQSYSNRYQIGPSVEFRLTSRLAIEGDVLYGRDHLRGFQAPTGAIPFPMDSLTAGGPALHFAGLAKWRILGGPLSPFVAAGPAARWTHFSGDLTRLDLTPTAQVTTVSHVDENHVAGGFAVGGGVEFRVEGLRIAPEARYTVYGSTSCSSCLSLSGGFPRLNPLVVILGIGF
jgi:hypothetical protein